jgi:hypothetical protein
LAWLYLHEENKVKAREHVEAGLRMDGENPYCMKMWQRLQTERE